MAELIGARRPVSFLDIGCGTGNYTCALEAFGGQWHGVDASSVMLEHAKRKSERIVWQRADAHAVPYPDRSFEGVICTLAIHHFRGLAAPFSEIHRVLDSGTFVVFTAFPDQMHNYWLCHYFPEMMARSIEQMPSKTVVVDSLCRAGFAVPTVVQFQVTNELQDLFLYAGKDRPQIYLDPTIRANMSSFATLCPPAELERGLDLLRSDIKGSRFLEVISRYSSSAGDYAFVSARKAA